MQTIINLEDGTDLNGYTVILPSVCVGNVAQLTADLIISTLQMKKVATFWHPAIIPVIGPRAFQHQSSEDDSRDNITTSCELFALESAKIACFQFRAPLVPALMETFFTELTNILCKQQISQLILLTSSYAHEQHLIDASKFVYLANDAFKASHTDQLEVSGWIEWTDPNKTIYGGGYALKLWLSANEKQLPSCILFRYVSEGDNRPEAVQLCEQLDQLLSGALLSKPERRLVVPISWKALFGNEPTEQLY